MSVAFAALLVGGVAFVLGWWLQWLLDGNVLL